jgi:hypothetical protein
MPRGFWLVLVGLSSSSFLSERCHMQAGSPSCTRLDLSQTDDAVRDLVLQVGAFANANLAQFHAEDGRGYELLGDVVEKVDKLNPQVRG